MEDEGSFPTPNPLPPGVDGLCPIIVDSVMMVSVMVSMAISEITGVASFILIRLSSFMSMPAFFKASLKAILIPVIFEVVPLLQ